MTDQRTGPDSARAVPPSFTRAELDGLVRMMDTVARSWADGDIPGALALLCPAADFTMMPPDGGPTVPCPGVPRACAGGEAGFELEQTYTSGDLAVLVGVERRRGVETGPPDRDGSLRLTLVFRRVGERWEQVHRHADPLVRRTPLEHGAASAGGPGS